MDRILQTRYHYHLNIMIVYCYKFKALISK